MKTATTFRWVARGLSLFFAGLFVLLFFGEGPPPIFALSAISLESWLLLIAVFAPLAAWRYELAGGLIGLVAIGAFYLTDFAAGGFRHFPRGWMLPAIALAPLLFLFAAWRRHAVQSHK